MGIAEGQRTRPDSFWYRRFGVSAVGLVLVLAACAPAASTTPSAASSGPSAASSVAVAESPSAPPKPVTITLWVPPMFQDVKGYEDQSKEVGDFWQWLADKYEEEHPHVTVELTRLSWDDMDPKVSVAVAAGTQPDLIFDFGGRLYKSFKAGGFEAVDDVYTSEEAKDFWPGMWGYSFDPASGKQYMVPAVSHAIGHLALVEDFWADSGKLALLPEIERQLDS